MNGVSLSNKPDKNYQPDTADSKSMQKIFPKNFTVLNNYQNKKDKVELVNKAKENANENMIFKSLRNLGFENPKKAVISFACSIATIIGVAFLGNKLALPASKLGNKIDNVLTGDGFIGKFRLGAINLLNKGKNFLSEHIKTPKFILNAKEALKKPLSPKWTIFRGYENGAKGVFSNTVVETMHRAADKDKGSVVSTLTNLLNGNSQAAENIIKELGNVENVKFADKLLNEIANANGCKDNPAKLREILEKLSNGEFGDGLRNIVMDKKEKGILSVLGRAVGSWWPANAINGVYKAITKKDCKFLRGDLGDSLLKYGAIRGKLAKTLPSKLVQILPPLVGDQVSNFVNDKSGFGIFLCANLIGNFNKLQDAPKDKKVKTALNDVASGSLSWMVTMPISYGLVYSLASLSKMGGSDIMSKIVRGVGKVFATGLDKPGALGGFKGVVGGVGRFLLALMVIQPFVSKKIDKLCSKIFGKPYNPAEAEKQKQLEKQMNTVIPELGITQKELLEKIQNKPDLEKILQDNPQLVAQIRQNPKKLLEILDSKPFKGVIKSNKVLSPANQNLIKKSNNTN